MYIWPIVITTFVFLVLVVSNFFQKRAIGKILSLKFDSSDEILKKQMKYFNISTWLSSILFLIIIAFATYTILSWYYFIKKDLPSSVGYIPSEIPAGESEAHEKEISLRPFVLTEYVFYEPSDEEFYSRSTRLPKGNGTILGKIMINDKPAVAFSIALRLDKGRVTKTVKTDNDGNFQVSLPKGEYFYKGFEIEGMTTGFKDKVLIKEEDIMLGSIEFSKEISQRYEDLKEKYGSEKASRMISEEMKSTFFDAFPLIIKDKPVKIPEIIYRDAIVLISPRGKIKSPLEKLNFVWESIPDAYSYRIDVVGIVREGTSTSYTPVAEQDNIKTNTLDCSKLLFTDGHPGLLENGKFKFNQLYGFRVYAYDKNGKLLTYSSSFDYLKFMIIE